MARLIKRFMCYSHMYNHDVNRQYLSNLFHHIYQNDKKFIDSKYLYLANFEHHVTTTKNTGEIVVHYYDNTENFGLTQYNINTGEIGMIIINREYRGKSLGKQIVTNIIEDMKVNNIKEVWAKAPHNHYFWANVLNKSFTFRTPNIPQKDIPCYFMKL